MNIKQSFGMASGLLALAVLGGCMTGDDPKSGATNLTLTTGAEVTEIETPVADSGIPGTLATTETGYSCDGDEVEETEYDKDYRYAIVKGSLYLWEPGDCTAMKFSGTSSKIQGTWTSDDLSVRIPTDYRSPMCDTATLENNSYEDFLKDAVVTYTITSSKIKGSIKGQLCYGALLAKQFEDMEDIEVLSEDCAGIKVRNEDVERTATMSVTFKDNALVQTIAYNGKTCKISYPAILDQTKEPTCSEEADDEQEEKEQAFQDCIEESEFAEDFNYGTAKTSSEFRSPLERALRVSLPL